MCQKYDAIQWRDNQSWRKNFDKDGEPTFLRKGVMRDWKSFFTPEQSREMGAGLQFEYKWTFKGAPTALLIANSFNALPQDFPLQVRFLNPKLLVLEKCVWHIRALRGNLLQPLSKYTTMNQKKLQFCMHLTSNNVYPSLA